MDALKPPTISPQLNALLSRVLADAPAPNGGKDFAASLKRNEAIQHALMDHASKAMEILYPGWNELMSMLIAKELEYRVAAELQAARRGPTA